MVKNVAVPETRLDRHINDVWVMYILCACLAYRFFIKKKSKIYFKQPLLLDRQDDLRPEKLMISVLENNSVGAAGQSLIHIKFPVSSYVSLMRF